MMKLPASKTAFDAQIGKQGKLHKAWDRILSTEHGFDMEASRDRGNGSQAWKVAPIFFKIATS
jgi:hypothetical protein